MDGSPVDLRLVDGGLLVEPAAARPPSFDELLDEVTESNLACRSRHAGSPQGSESWANLPWVPARGDIGVDHDEPRARARAIWAKTRARPVSLRL